MTGQHGLADLDGGLGAARRGADPGAAPVGQPEGLGVFDADPQRALGIAFAPGRVAEDVVGGIGAPLPTDSTIRNSSVVSRGGPLDSFANSCSIAGISSAILWSGWPIRVKSSA